MTAFSPLVRRSILRVPILDREAVAGCWRHNADAIILDLTDTVPERDKPAARTRLSESIAAAGRGGAEVFAQINKNLAYADIKAAVKPGLSGVVLPDAETETDLQESISALAEMERVEGISPGRLEVALILTTPAGVWNVHELLSVSERVTAVALSESDLCRSMGITADDEFDPFAFARGRIIVEALAAVRLPLGMCHPLAGRPRRLDEAQLEELATRARNTGYKGTICPYPSWVEPCNRAYTPTDSQVTYYREVREAFAEGVARGTAAVPFRGRMLDVPVDERAKDMIALWERCRYRDEAKAAAMAASG
jgi:citrate lyase subunit beta / citryl-CoA lyase